jgi:hypothetical protein
MTTMKMPGFTAEASLHHANTITFQWPRPIPQAEGSVIPQRIKLRDWTCECDAATDICVCTSGGAMRVIHAVLGEI